MSTFDHHPDPVRRRAKARAVAVRRSDDTAKLVFAVTSAASLIGLLLTLLLMRP